MPEDKRAFDRAIEKKASLPEQNKDARSFLFPKGIKNITTSPAGLKYNKDWRNSFFMLSYQAQLN